MANTWYELVRWSGDVRPVSIERETESCLWINGRRSYKRSDYSCFFPTENDAYSEIVARLRRTVDGYRSNLAKAEYQLHIAEEKLSQLTK